MHYNDLHAKRIHAAVGSGGAAHSRTVASWRRCSHSYGLDPSSKRAQRRLSAAELSSSLEVAGPILRLAVPTLDKLCHAVKTAGACVLLADAHGVSVHWTGAVGDEPQLKRLGLCAGIDWSERCEGTNGIGTCLIDRIPITIVREQHFHARDTSISCVAAPVYCNDGAIAGVVNVAIYGRSDGNAFLRLVRSAVEAAAHQIERDRFHQEHSGDRVISMTNEACVGHCLVAVDADGVVTGATRAARTAFGLSNVLLRDGVCFDDLLGHEGHDGLHQAERGALRRALVRSAGNVTAAAKALDVSRATMKRKMKASGLRRRD